MNFETLPIEPPIYGRHEFRPNKIEFDEDEEQLTIDIVEKISQIPETKSEKFQETNETLCRLAEKVAERFTDEDQALINNAIELMYQLHLDQADRPGGEPYVGHPLSVAETVMVIEPEAGKDIVIAALMHDAVEDQAAKLSHMAGEFASGIDERARALEYLRNLFGDKVNGLVKSLSNPDFDAALVKRGITELDPNYRVMKNQLYAEHVQEAIEDPEVLVLKLADFSENALKLSGLPEETPEQLAKKTKLIKKYTPVMQIFLERLKRDNLYPEYQARLQSEVERYQ